VRKITIAAVGLALAATFAWQYSTGQAARASEGRLTEPPSVGAGPSAAGLNGSAGVVGRPAPVAPSTGDLESSNRQSLPLRETLRLAVSERESVGVAMPRVARTMLPIRPSISPTAEPRGVSAPMPTRPEVGSVELPHAPVVSVPSPARAGTLASTPSFVNAASDRTGGVAADADALKSLVEMFAGPKPRAGRDSGSRPR
jgi:hypothetical protein